jgi:hypothetical protein
MNCTESKVWWFAAIKSKKKKKNNRDIKHNIFSIKAVSMNSNDILNWNYTQKL